MINIVEINDVNYINNLKYFKFITNFLINMDKINL